MHDPLATLFNIVHWDILDPPKGEPDHDSALPYATHRGELRIGDMTLICFQLSNGTRVFEAESVEQFFAGLTEEED
jgi:hypothetical protein